MILSAADYDPAVTELCERALVTVIGDAGFWGARAATASLLSSKIA
ncbi:MAG: hypothetical protein M0Z49_14730 [Chloroflexi bacterium]|nr:hypothetical protein [Chloroflexota bacterium]